MNVSFVLKQNFREIQLKVKRAHKVGKAKWRNFWDERMLDRFFDAEELVILENERLMISHMAAYNKVVARLKLK